MGDLYLPQTAAAEIERSYIPGQSNEGFFVYPEVEDYIAETEHKAENIAMSGLKHNKKLREIGLPQDKKLPKNMTEVRNKVIKIITEDHTGDFIEKILDSYKASADTAKRSGGSS